jgi:8-oxo-dGTP diphosphatase
LSIILREEPPVLTSHDVLEGLRPLAGGIVWRRGPLASPEILLVHHARARKRAWGFPKGRLERGETAREAALREVQEETGFRCRCEALVGSVVYRSRRGRSRVATYWFMTPVRGGSQVSSEIDRIEWVSLERAARRMAGRPEVALLAGVVEAPAPAQSA